MPSALLAPTSESACSARHRERWCGRIPSMPTSRPRTFGFRIPEVFLAQFGRPKRELACECERANDTSMNQAFQFISGPMVNKLISRRDNVLGSLLKQNAAPEKAVNELYWTLLTRAPTKDETAQLSAFIAKAADKRVALEDIAWSLVNAKEFVLRK